MKPGLVKGSWSQEEDDKLRHWVTVTRKNQSLKWAEATQVIEGRSGKQIRERWFNILNPQINKGKWGEAEEKLLFQLYQKYGPKWCSLVQYFEGRTENSIKNRFYSTLRRVATEYKRNADKNLAKRKSRKSKGNKGDLELKSESLAKDACYLPNPQVAKTEELLRLLPMVVKTLKAHLKDLPKSLRGKDSRKKNCKTKKSEL